MYKRPPRQGPAEVGAVTKMREEFAQKSGEPQGSKGTLCELAPAPALAEEASGQTNSTGMDGPA